METYEKHGMMHAVYDHDRDKRVIKLMNPPPLARFYQRYVGANGALVLQLAQRSFSVTLALTPAAVTEKGGIKAEASPVEKRIIRRSPGGAAPASRRLLLFVRRHQSDALGEAPADAAQPRSPISGVITLLIPKFVAGTIFHVSVGEMSRAETNKSWVRRREMQHVSGRLTGGGRRLSGSNVSSCFQLQIKFQVNLNQESQTEENKFI